jgi:excisionase family DNA binding protein
MKRTAQINREYLTRGDVAKLFGVSPSTVTRWAQKGLLKTIRTPGGHYRFPATETLAAVGSLS